MSGPETETQRVVVSLGSNVDAENNLRSSLNLLERQFGRLELSPVYQNQGYHQDDSSIYLNCVVIFTTKKSRDHCMLALKNIEKQLGRLKSNINSGEPVPVSCDLDLLLFGNTKNSRAKAQPHDDILKRDFILRPLKDLLGQENHPSSGRSYASHWQELTQKTQQKHSLTPIDFFRNQEPSI